MDDDFDTPFGDVGSIDPNPFEGISTEPNNDWSQTPAPQAQQIPWQTGLNSLKTAADRQQPDQSGWQSSFNMQPNASPQVMSDAQQALQPNKQYASLNPPSQNQWGAQQPRIPAINQQATLSMVDYLKQNLGKSPADANIKADLDNVSQMVKSGKAYTNWAYCAGILYAAAQKAGVAPEALSAIKSPLLASAWQLGERQEAPSVGNFAYWPHGHISMVSAYDPERKMVQLIGGNQGGIGSSGFRPISQTGWVPQSYSGVRYYRGYDRGGKIPDRDTWPKEQPRFPSDREDGGMGLFPYLEWREKSEGGKHYQPLDPSGKLERGRPPPSTYPLPKFNNLEALLFEMFRENMQRKMLGYDTQTFDDRRPPPMEWATPEDIEEAKNGWKEIERLTKPRNNMNPDVSPDAPSRPPPRIPVQPPQTIQPPVNPFLRLPPTAEDVPMYRRGGAVSRERPHPAIAQLDRLLERERQSLGA